MSNPMHDYEQAPVSELQRLALEYLIVKSRNASKFAKQLAIWMIRQSDNLSKPFFVYIPATFSALAREAGDGFHDMKSANCTTHLNEVMRAMNTMMVLQMSSGDAVHKSDASGGFTFWISLQSDPYSCTVPEIPFSLGAIQVIQIDE